MVGRDHALEHWGILVWVNAVGMILATATLAGLIAGCQKPSRPAPPPPGVTVANPLQKEITDWNEYTGRLTAVESVEVRPRVSGHIASIHFVEGQEVKEGALLFVIDKRPFEAEVNRAKARLSQAKAAQSLANANLERAKKLASTQVISKEEADVRVSEAMQADADVEQAIAQLDSANLQLGFTDVRSPITGIASRHLVTRGNVVQGGSGEGTLLTTVVPHDPIYVYFEADEAAVISAIRRYFQGTQPGRGERASRPVEMQLSDEKNFPHKGEIDFVDNQLDPGSNTMEMRGRFENPDRFFTPGMFARVRVPSGGPQEALLVPEEAIVSDLTARFLWVLKSDGTVERRPVELGGRHGTLRVVRSGVAAQDKVVIKGIQTLRPDTKVTPHEGSIADPSGAPAQDEKISLPIAPAKG
jgi:membrane fusion protein, multidrug efflux system